MRVLLFGGDGFLGTAIKKALRGSVHAIVDVPRIDITDYANFKEVPTEVDVVINCAAKIPSIAPLLYAEMEKVNVGGARNVAQWVRNNSIGHLVHCSTASTLLRPDNEYAISKRKGEEEVLRILPDATILRFSALYGEGMQWFGVIPTFVDAALSGKKMRASSGARADFLHVEDAARSVVSAIEKRISGIVNVASGVEMSIVELASIVVSAAPKSGASIEIVDSPLSRAIVDITRMKAELDFEPSISIQEGIKSIIQSKIV